MKDMKNFNQSNFTLSNSCTFNRSSVHISNLAPLSLRSCTFIRSSVYTSTLSSLHPWFLTGFADAEGSFTVSISKNKELKLG